MCGHRIDLPAGLIVGLSKPTPRSVHQPLPDWIGWSRLFLLLLSQVVTWYSGFYCQGHGSLSLGLILRIKFEEDNNEFLGSPPSHLCKSHSLPDSLLEVSRTCVILFCPRLHHPGTAKALELSKSGRNLWTSGDLSSFCPSPQFLYFCLLNIVLRLLAWFLMKVIFPLRKCFSFKG